MSVPRMKPRILCVDDERHVLDGLELNLRRHYDVDKAMSGPDALALLERTPGVAVIISDMRMPGMDGATFLAQSRVLAPDATRMLLTGQADLGAAIAAINEGRIFRFLSKPCAPASLIAAVAAAAEQHRLVIAERVLLEETLRGSIKALTDVLALVSPASFGRATRIRNLVATLAGALDLPERWQVDVAAMLSQLGCITLSPDLAERVYQGAPLTAEEHKLVSRLPTLTEELLGNIPRLDEVREILRAYPRAFRPEPGGDARRKVVADGAHLLRLAVDFDALESIGGASAAEAVETLRARAGVYDPRFVEALTALRGGADAPVVRELSALQLRPGMILAEDVKTKSGALLVARGYEITDRFLERIRNFSSDTVHKPTWRVVVDDGAPDTARLAS